MGILIAFEGIDGSGKATQASELFSKLSKQSLKVELLTFPMYQTTFFGHEVGRYLDGAFGELRAVHPKLAALLYAGDRFESRNRILKSINSTDVLICDRFTGSNQAHHAAKLPLPERKGFTKWIERLECEIFGIPQPNLVIFLDISPEEAVKLIRQKSTRSYTNRKADIHEADFGYLTDVATVYRDLAKKSNWVTVRCVQKNVLRTIAEIHTDIWTQCCGLCPHIKNESSRVITPEADHSVTKMG